MAKAVSGAVKTPLQTLCEGHNSTGTSGISKERKRTGSLQF